MRKSNMIVVISMFFFRFVVSIILLASGFLHLQNLPVHFVSITNYHLVPVEAAEWLATILPVVHVMCGLGILLGEMVRASAIFACLLFGIYLTSQIVVVLLGMQVDCGCFGTSHVEAIGWTTILRTFSFFVLAALLAFFCCSGRLAQRTQYGPQ